MPGFATLKQTGCTATDENGVCTNASFLTAPQSSGVNAVTLVPDGAQTDYWSGVDTNFVLRARGGLRISGGTSRRATRIRSALAARSGGGRGPWVDVLASAVFTCRPGVTINANYQVALTELTFQEGAARTRRSSRA